MGATSTRFQPVGVLHVQRRQRHVAHALELAARSARRLARSLEPGVWSFAQHPSQRRIDVHWVGAALRQELPFLGRPGVVGQPVGRVREPWQRGFWSGRGAASCRIGHAENVRLSESSPSVARKHPRTRGNSGHSTGRQQGAGFRGADRAAPSVARVPQSQAAQISSLRRRQRCCATKPARSWRS